jgi:hypothetical protein
VGGAGYAITASEAVQVYRLIPAAVHNNTAHDPVHTNHQTFLAHIGNQETAHGGSGDEWDELRVAGIETAVAGLQAFEFDVRNP